MDYKTLVQFAGRIAFNVTSAYIYHQTATSRPASAVPPPKTIYQHLTEDLFTDDWSAELIARQYGGLFDEVSLRLQEAAYDHTLLAKDTVEIHGNDMSVMYLITRRASNGQHSFAHKQHALRNAVMMTLQWIAQQGRLSEVLEILATLTYIVMMDDGEDDGMTQDQRIDAAQQALWLHILCSLHTAIEHTEESVQNPDTPWAWQRPLVIEQFVHIINTVNTLRDICVQVVEARNL